MYFKIIASDTDPNCAGLLALCYDHESWTYVYAVQTGDDYSPELFGKFRMMPSEDHDDIFTGLANYDLSKYEWDVSFENEMEQDILPSNRKYSNSEIELFEKLAKEESKFVTRDEDSEAVFINEEWLEKMEENGEYNSENWKDSAADYYFEYHWPYDKY